MHDHVTTENQELIAITVPMQSRVFLVVIVRDRSSLFFDKILSRVSARYRCDFGHSVPMVEFLVGD